MNKLTTVECVVARILAVVASGVIVAAVAAPVAQHFNYSLPQGAQYGLGAVAAILCWFASRKAFDFATDCMSVPTLAPAFSPRATAPREPLRSGTANVISLSQTPQPNGSVEISVTAN